ncbi:hypothetical protein BJ912DRAFT_1068889 [Pholiota molesta]|nr:hypothetical protein BJ912DRAFT_1068889 [Pholiota molesta]
MPRNTRAREYADAPEEFLVAANADFDLADCLKAKVDLVNSAVCSGSSDLFSLSPLTSPEPTPPPSPQIAPTYQPPVPTSDSLTGPSLPKKTALPPSTKARDRGAAKKAASQKYVNLLDPVCSNIATENAAVQSTGLVGKNDGSGHKKTYRLTSLVGEGSKFKFHLKKWDGRAPVCIADKSKRTVAVLAGCPPVEIGRSFTSKQLPLWKKSARMRRLAWGGQKQPAIDKRCSDEKILEELNELEPFKRMAAFASACMANWRPKLYTIIPSFARAFSPLPLTTLALKQYATSTGFCQPTFGWCAVWALGTFDPTEVPYSPCVCAYSHSNTSIAPTSAGTPFALYTAGALFRWVSNCFMKAEDYYSQLSPEQLEVEEQKKAQRWMEG